MLSSRNARQRDFAFLVSVLIGTLKPGAVLHLASGQLEVLPNSAMTFVGIASVPSPRAPLIFRLAICVALARMAHRRPRFRVRLKVNRIRTFIRGVELPQVPRLLFDNFLAAIQKTAYWRRQNLPPSRHILVLKFKITMQSFRA